MNSKAPTRARSLCRPRPVAGCLRIGSSIGCLLEATPRRQRFNKIDVKGEMTGNDTVQLPAWKAELPGRSTTACGSAPSSYQIDRKTLQVSKLPPSDDWVTWTILISGWTASQA